MRQVFATLAGERGLLRLSGPDARDFLQGIVSNDVHKLSPTRALWAAFLTPQGKYLHDFFLAEQEGALLLETEAARLAELAKRLRPYRLRSKVTIEEAGPDWTVALLWGEGTAAALGLPAEAGAASAFGGGLAFLDPRLAEAGARAILPTATAEQSLQAAGFTLAARVEHERRRIALGLPDGSRDLALEKALLLENGFDELGGVDWKKGCWLGQELTARTKYRGLVKKRLLPVRFEGAAPPPGTAVSREGREVGEIRSSAGEQALALLRLEALEGPLQAEGAALRVERPAWLRLQAEENA